MVVSLRQYIFATFLLSCLSLVSLGIGVATQNWVNGSNERTDVKIFNFGLFKGTYIISIVGSRENTIHQTCLLDKNVCAYSCRPTSELRKLEVQSYYDKNYLEINCGSSFTNDNRTSIDEVVWFNGGVYVSSLVFLGLAVFFTVLCALLGIYNTNRTPIEPIWGIFGLYIWNGLAATFTLATIIMWGVHFDTNIKDVVPLIPVMFDDDHAKIKSEIGYSYWLLLVPIICHLVSEGLLFLREHLIRTQPPPPKISIENKDDTIFLY